jgi:putative flippase GtrA
VAIQEHSSGRFAGVVTSAPGARRSGPGQGLKPIAIVPAYKPESCLVQTVQALLASGRFATIVAVDDGSGQAYEPVFEALATLQVPILRHAVNLGKGMALRTAFNFVACHFPESAGVVTFDADGQHLVPDILAVADALTRAPGSLVLGSRAFGSDVPLRSKIGNLATRGVMRLLCGLRLADTQTGLRGIPGAFLPALLRLNTSGYDFELDMLVRSRYDALKIIEVPIATVYADGNRTSSFNPLLDSLKIYLVFLRFNLSSILSVVIDYAVFALLYTTTKNLLAAQAVARCAAGSVNYLVNRQFVFRSRRPHVLAVSLYVLLLFVMGGLAFVIISTLRDTFAVNVFAAKVLAEGALYGVSFVLQRDVVFPLPASDEG